MPSSVRGSVDGLSRSSKRRLRGRLRNADQEWVAFMTLTYGAEWPRDGRVVKRHLQAMKKRMKRELGDELCVVWAMEFQDRGAPHFHLLVDGWVKNKWAGQSWNAIVALGDLDHLAAGVQVKRPRADAGAYFLKEYMAKADQKIVPADFVNPGRMWGVWGEVGELLGELEIAERPGDKVNRVARAAVESRSERRQPRRTKGRRQGNTVHQGGEESATRAVTWAEGEIEAGR